MTISIKNDSVALQSEKFTVYGRADCHLCQQMILALEKLSEQVSLHYQVIDIDTDPALISLYGEKIPVLVSPTHEVICYHFFNFLALDDYLGKIR